MSEWRLMGEVPRNCIVWLTDGQTIRRAHWTADVHGAPGWKEVPGGSFDHFRQWRALGWLPFIPPEPPNWPREAVEDWVAEARTALGSAP